MDISAGNGSKPLRVLLVNPPPWKVVEPWYDEPAFPRQAIAYLAGYLRQFGVFDVRVIDAKLERIGFAEVTKRALELESDVVGITAFTHEIKPAAHLAGLIKKGRPQTITVIGGVHVTALPVATLREFSSFDIGCRGEGEITFYELCTAIHQQVSYATVPGLVYRKGQTIVLSPERMKSLDLDSMPFPANDLFPEAKEYFVMSQRGCPFRCTFCMNPNGRVPRQRSVKNVIDEIVQLMDIHKAKRLHFGDELFTVNMERTHVLLDEMIRIGVPKRTNFFITTHVNFVDYEMFKHLKAAGCTECALGIETGDEQQLRKMGKGTNLNMVKAAFDAARKARLPLNSLFIIGHPNETEDSIKETIAFATKLNPSTPVLGLMVPYPGTEVAGLAAKGAAGYRLATTDWDEFNKQIGGALEFANLSREKIEYYQIWGYLQVFLRNWRFIDLMKFVWRYRTSGFSLLSKIVKLRLGVKGGPVPHASNREVNGVSRDELAEATVKWGQNQIANLAYARKFGTPELMRVIAKNNVKDRSSSPLT